MSACLSVSLFVCLCVCPTNWVTLGNTFLCFPIAWVNTRECFLNSFNFLFLGHIWGIFILNFGLKPLGCNEEGMHGLISFFFVFSNSLVKCLEPVYEFFENFYFQVIFGAFVGQNLVPNLCGTVMFFSCFIIRMDSCVVEEIHVPSGMMMTLKVKVIGLFLLLHCKSYSLMTLTTNIA